MKIIHPRSVYTVRVGGRIVEDDTLTGAIMYFFTYIAIFTGAVLIVSLDGMDLVSTFTSVAATIGNIGPGLEVVGPMGNFSDFSVLSKIVFSVIMLFGRLEIFPMMILFTKTFWKRVNI
jgi:trk system potassium uptake protein TrkH